MVEFLASAVSRSRGLAGSSASSVILFGRVVTMNGARTVIENGEVGVVGNRIVHVGHRSSERPPELTGALEVETRGTIFPGLIELHNHPAYNAIPLWDTPLLFRNRSEWRDHSGDYLRKVRYPSYLIGKNRQDADYPRAVARFVECKAVLGGQTTYAGISAEDGRNYVGMVRNVEFPNETGWPAVVGWINDFKSVPDAEKKISPILGDRQNPRLLHLSEGTDEAARSVFYYLQKSDGTWLLAANILTIHGLGLLASDFPALSLSGGLVWSPLSNLLLYGRTADVGAAKRSGVRLALGADWAPSGSKNLLGELKIARIVSAREGGLFTDRELVEMVTCSPAAMLGWDGWLGSIEKGKRADLAIISGTDKEAYDQLICATEEDVTAVLIDGVARCGRSDLINPQSPNAETFRVGRSTFLIDLAESSSNDPLAGLTLSAAIEKLAFGFAHLPELAKTRNEHKGLMSVERSALTLHLDMDETDRADVDAYAAGVPPEPEISPGDVDRMVVEPITQVDDVGFYYRIRASRNVPDWLKQAI